MLRNTGRVSKTSLQKKTCGSSKNSRKKLDLRKRHSIFCKLLAGFISARCNIIKMKVKIN